MAEGGVDDPALALARGPHAVAVPVEGISGAPVPLQVPDVAFLELDGMTVERAHDRDPSEWAVWGVRPRRPSRPRGGVAHSPWKERRGRDEYPLAVHVSTSCRAARHIAGASEHVNETRWADSDRNAAESVSPRGLDSQPKREYIRC